MAKILIVDDSPTVRKYHSLVLSGLGYRVSAAEDGAAGLELLLRDNFSLVITDINMPRMDGFQFLSEIRDMPEYQSIPVLIVSSQDHDIDMERGRELGANCFIVKPTNVEQLAAWVRQLLPRGSEKGNL
jgi:two-component system, chemotaxis family, chemotaxis protein CheY